MAGNALLWRWSAHTAALANVVLQHGEIIFYFILFYFKFLLDSFKRKKIGRKREGQEGFQTCSRIPALLVVRNVTTQAPSCNNVSSLRWQ